MHLPIHAAGLPEDNRVEGLTHHAVPSYTPTLGALLNARRDMRPVRKIGAQLLLAAVPRGFRWRYLPSAEEEMLIIKTIVPAVSTLQTNDVTCRDARTSGATAQDVLQKLPEAAILHLACHGHQSLQNPLESGFVMSDRMLTVEELMGLHLPHAFFAFLSACETAKGDDQQPDQAIHLAATMLFAGFKSVIGTMW